MNQPTATHKERRFQWLGKISASRHYAKKMLEPDGLNHAVIELKGTLAGSSTFGKVILIGCACNSTFWRNHKAVPDYQVEGEWAAPFRKALGVREKPSAGHLKRHRKFLEKENG